MNTMGLRWAEARVQNVPSKSLPAGLAAPEAEFHSFNPATIPRYHVRKASH